MPNRARSITFIHKNASISCLMLWKTHTSMKKGSTGFTWFYSSKVLPLFHTSHQRNRPKCTPEDISINIPRFPNFVSGMVTTLNSHATRLQKILGVSSVASPQWPSCYPPSFPDPKLVWGEQKRGSSLCLQPWRNGKNIEKCTGDI